MPRGKGIYDDEGADEPTSGPRDPSDQADDNRAETREMTPDVAETDQEPTA